ncbi:MAG: DMT family transporter [bacterium]
MTSRERAGALALVVVTISWGVSFPLVSDAVTGRSGGQLLIFLGLRFLLASLAFLPIMGRVIAAGAGHGARPWLFSLVIGALLFAAFYLQTLGLKYTTPSRSAFVTMLSVPMVPFLAAFMSGRRLSRVHVAGSILAIIGVALVLAPEGRVNPNRGDLLTLGSAFFFAVEILMIEYATRRAPALCLAFGQIAAAALFFGLALLIVQPIWPAEWPGLMLGVGVTGIVCTTFALGLMTWGGARVRAELAAVIFALEPVSAAFFEWALQGRAMVLSQWVAGLVVVAAVAGSSYFGAPEENPAGAQGPR